MTVKELYEYALEHGCENTEITVDAKSIADEYIANVVSDMNEERYKKDINSEWQEMSSKEILLTKGHDAYYDLECAAYGDGVVLGYHDREASSWEQLI